MAHSKEVILARHSESETNASEVFQAGSQIETDPLTNIGKGQAEALAPQFAHVAIDAIVSSAYRRARETAETIQVVIDAPISIPLIRHRKIIDADPDDKELIGTWPSLLREIDLPSELAGLEYNDKRAIAVREAMARAHAIKSSFYPSKKHYADEENLYDLWRRAERITDYLEERSEDRLLVVAHGGILKVWLAHVLFGRQEKGAPLVGSVKQSRQTRRSLLAYQQFARHTWWDNTGFVSLRFDTERGWQLPISSIPHLKPLYPNIMPLPGEEERRHDDQASEYLE